MEKGMVMEKNIMIKKKEKKTKDYILKEKIFIIENGMEKVMI